MADINFLRQFRNTPEGQALLSTIRYAEGTERGGPDSYRVMYGGSLAPNLERHPDKVIRGGRYSSSAAGAYQFLTPTWNSVASQLGLKKFGPEEQDVAALHLARNRLMPIGGLSALQQKGFTQDVAAALSPEWASFPTHSGRSYYGQPVKSYDKLREVYESKKRPGSPSLPTSTEPATAARQSTQAPTQAAGQNSSDDFQKLLQYTMLSQMQTQSPIQQLLDRQLKEAMTGGLGQYQMSADIAGFGFPGLLG